MSFFDGIVGGLVSVGATAIINHAIQEHGGIENLVSQFQQKGLGGVAQSWVSTGTNQPINPSQITQALGSDFIKGIAAKLGVPEEQVASTLAEHLPAAVNQMTPEGKLPAAAAA